MERWSQGELMGDERWETTCCIVARHSHPLLLNFCLHIDPRVGRRLNTFSKQFSKREMVEAICLF